MESQESLNVEERDKEEVKALPNEEDSTRHCWLWDRGGKPWAEGVWHLYKPEMAKKRSSSVVSEREWSHRNTLI